MARAFLPGTFDPIHNGHIDLIRRASLLFEEVIVAVYCDGQKPCMFSQSARIEMATRALQDIAGVQVLPFDDESTAHVEDATPQVYLAGLRVFSDFDRQFLHSITNPHTSENLDQVGLISGEGFTYLSSGLVREIAGLGGDVRSMVPDFVAAALRERCAELEADSL
jgi:pantetheine-phosphate adenylyltransferase